MADRLVVFFGKTPNFPEFSPLFSPSSYNNLLHLDLTKVVLGPNLSHLPTIAVPAQGRVSGVPGVVLGNFPEFLGIESTFLRRRPSRFNAIFANYQTNREKSQLRGKTRNKHTAERFIVVHCSLRAPTALLSSCMTREILTRAI